MNKRDFSEHLAQVLAEVVHQLDGLPHNADVSGITVADNSRFVYADDGMVEPETRKKEFRQSLRADIRVKMRIGVETKIDQKTGKPSVNRSY